jgi:hypothetical protein
MKIYFKGAGKFLAPLCLTIITCLFILTPVAVSADGVGLSGNFYRQHFELSPGESSEASDIYVVVFNNGDSTASIDMVTEAPDGVTILLSQDEFTLDAGKSQTVSIEVQVGLQVAPGEYTLLISADVYREGTGIKITGGGQQEARLSILGEAGTVTINSTTTDNSAFPALICLYQYQNGVLAAVRTPQTGTLKTRLNPGDYVVQAQYQNIIVAEEIFTLAANEEKNITLTCHTLYVKDFSVEPNLSGDNRLTSAKISYTVVNLYQPVKDVGLVLVVEFGSQKLDETGIVSFSTLDAGPQGGSYNYMPAQGWQSGSYSFSLQMEVNGEVYAVSKVEALESGVMATTGQTSPTGTAPTGNDWLSSLSWDSPWVQIGSLGCAVLLLILLVIIILRRKK